MRTLTIAEAHQSLAELINEIASDGSRVTITQNDEAAAVLIGATEYDSLVETVAVLSDGALVAEISEGLAETRAGEVVTHDVVRSDIAARSRS